MSKKTLAQAADELAAACRSFGASIDEATGIIEVMKKVNNKGSDLFNKHPFAKYFKRKKNNFKW